MTNNDKEMFVSENYRNNNILSLLDTKGLRVYYSLISQTTVYSTTYASIMHANIASHIFPLNMKIY